MEYAELRKRMVNEQLLPRGIKNSRVIEAFLKIERHKFIPTEAKRKAYEDFPIPIGEGQTISQPYIVALMTECLDLKGNEKVLEIGTGSGYQAAILAELANQIYTVERIPALAQRAKETLQELGYSNVKVKVDDGTLGWPEEAPFSRIIITAAAPDVPFPLIEQLAEGGKMVLPLGERFSQVLTIIEKKKGKIKQKAVCGCIFVPLIGKYAYKSRDAL